MKIRHSIGKKTSEALTEKLIGARLNKHQIMQLVDALVSYPELTGVLLKVIFEQDKLRKNFNGCWVFDHLMRKKLGYLLPYMNVFIEGLTHISWESTLRPMAHVLEMVNERYFVKKDAAYTKTITTEQQEIMAEVCFDWLIGPHKVAGRYRNKTSNLAPFFSEEALIKYRVQVEIEYFIALCELPIQQFQEFDTSKFGTLRDIYLKFSAEDANAIKEIEKTTNHDVKAVEYFIKQKLYLCWPEHTDSLPPLLDWVKKLQFLWNA